MLDAARTCVARVGIAKTTLDDVAREAGCARATVYRNFAGKQDLLQAMVQREADRFGAATVAAAADAATLGDAAVAVVLTGARFAAEHEALRFVMAVEPGLLLPYISFEAGDGMLAEAATRLAPAFDRFVDAEHALRLAEWIVRFGISYLCSPEAADIYDADRVRALVTDFILPGLARPVSDQGVTA